MNFSSPAQDYIEDWLDLNKLFILPPSATFLIEYGNLSYVVDSFLKPWSGLEVCYGLFGEQGIDKIMGRAIITPGGEALEGTVLDEMSVCGVFVVQVIKACDDWQPLQLLNTNNGGSYRLPIRSRQVNYRHKNTPLSMCI